MTLLGAAGLVWALGAGLLAPGWVVVRRLDLGRDTFERLVLAVAVGRILLGIAALVATATPFPSALHLWPRSISRSDIMRRILMIPGRSRHSLPSYSN